MTSLECVNSLCKLRHTSTYDRQIANNMSLSRVLAPMLFANTKPTAVTALEFFPETYYIWCRDVTSLFNLPHSPTFRVISLAEDLARAAIREGSRWLDVTETAYYYHIPQEYTCAYLICIQERRESNTRYSSAHNTPDLTSRRWWSCTQHIATNDCCPLESYAYT